MFFEGNSGVLVRLFQKKQLLAEGDPRHEEIRPALLVLSGGMRGVYGGGQVLALENSGLTRVFDVVLGISTGAPTVAYFLAGQVPLGVSVYYEECTTAHFLSLMRGVRGGHIMDVDWLCKVFRGEISQKKLDQEKVRLSRTSFWVAATNAETGKRVFLDAKTVEPDVVEAIRASIAEPGLSHGNVSLNGVRHLGGASVALPISQIIESFNPTDLLVLANCSEEKRYRSNTKERLLLSWLMSDLPADVRNHYTERNKTFIRELKLARKQDACRIAIVWTDDKIGQFERNTKKLQSAGARAQAHLSKLLAAAELAAPALIT